MKSAQTPCHILLLNTYTVSVNENDSGKIIPLHDELKKKSKIGLQAEQREAQKSINNPNIILEASSHIGTLKSVIQRVLKREKIDLVAMGKDGGTHVEAIAALLKEMEFPLLITHLPTSKPKDGTGD